MGDLEMQQYLFDLQGYLVIENVLTEAEVSKFNELLDKQELPAPGQTQRFGSAPEGPGFCSGGSRCVIYSITPGFCQSLDFGWVTLFA